MNRERRSTAINVPIPASGHIHAPSPSPTSGRTNRDLTPHGAPHLHQTQQYQLPNRSGRQTRHPIHRESQHYPMAERCMCSSCHLSSKLFPRTGDGRIVLPIVPLTRSPSAHPYGSAPGGCYVGESGDLAQYMLAPSDSQSGEFSVSSFRGSRVRLSLSYSGHGRPSTSSTTSSMTMTTASYASGSSSTPNLHDRATVRLSGGAHGSGTMQVQSSISVSLHPELTRHTGSTSDARMPSFGT